LIIPQQGLFFRQERAKRILLVTKHYKWSIYRHALIEIWLWGRYLLAGPLKTSAAPGPAGQQPVIHSEHHMFFFLAKENGALFRKR